MSRELNSKPNWTFPTIPKGYDTAAITVYTSGTIELEYYGQRGWFKKKPKIYSHETGISPSWEWPWRDGYKPNLEDWKSLGFFAGHGFDCGDNYPPEIKYRSWLNYMVLRDAADKGSLVAAKKLQSLVAPSKEPSGGLFAAGLMLGVVLS